MERVAIMITTFRDPAVGYREFELARLEPFLEQLEMGDGVF